MQRLQDLGDPEGEALLSQQTRLMWEMVQQTNNWATLHKFDPTRWVEMLNDTGLDRSGAVDLYNLARLATGKAQAMVEGNSNRTT